MTDQPAKRHGVLVAVLIALWGPAIGSLLVFVLVFMRSAVVDGVLILNLDQLQTIAAMFMFVTVFAYISAGLPAILCGLYLGWYTSRHGGFSRRRAVAAGLVASVAGLVLMDMVRLLRDGGGVSGSLLPISGIIIPVAMLTALLGQILLARFGVIPTR